MTESSSFWSSTRVRRWVGIGGAVGVVGLLVYLAWPTIMLLGISFFIAYLLDPVVDRLERRKVPRTLTILLLILAVSLGVFFLLLILIPQIQVQARQVAERAPEWGQWLLRHLVPLLERLGVPLPKEGLQAYAVQAWEGLRANFPGFTEPVFRVFGTMFTGLGNFILGVVSIVFVPVFSFYLLRDFDVLGERFYAAMPPHWRPVVADWSGELDQVVGGFLRGQFTIAMILAALYATGLGLLGVPMGIVLGVTSGLANMVPYMSIVVGLLPAILLSLLDDPSWWRVLGILLIYTGGQLLEGVYLGPRIVGRETGLHPVIVMASIMVGGTLFGLLGILVSVPVAAILKVVVLRLHRAWRARWPQSASE